MRAEGCERDDIEGASWLAVGVCWWELVSESSCGFNSRLPIPVCPFGPEGRLWRLPLGLLPGFARVAIKCCRKMTRDLWPSWHLVCQSHQCWTGRGRGVGRRPCWQGNSVSSVTSFVGGFLFGFAQGARRQWGGRFRGPGRGGAGRAGESPVGWARVAGRCFVGRWWTFGGPARCCRLLARPGRPPGTHGLLWVASVVVPVVEVSRDLQVWLSTLSGGPGRCGPGEQLRRGGPIVAEGPGMNGAKRGGRFISPLVRRVLMFRPCSAGGFCPFVWVLESRALAVNDGWAGAPGEGSRVGDRLGSAYVIAR